VQKSIQSPRKGQVVHRASSPKGGTSEAVSPACPLGRERKGCPALWHRPARWGGRAANSEHLSPGQTWSPLPEQVLPAPGRRTHCPRPDRLGDAGTPPHRILRNQLVETPAGEQGCGLRPALPRDRPATSHRSPHWIQLRGFFLWAGHDQGVTLE